MQEPFSSEEKSLVRDSCLRQVVDLKNKANRTLTYFGLPSPWMADVAAWQPHIGRIFAVEMEERFIPDLVDRSYVLGLMHKLSYFTGNIDNILHTGTDTYGRDIQKVFPVDIINLDYCSGLVYEGFERIAALESVFLNQTRSILADKNIKLPYFLLFITHRSDQTSGKQKIYKEYLSHLTKDIDLYQDIVKQNIALVTAWYTSDKCPVEYKHKTFVLGKVLEFAENRGFQVSIEEIISYKGDNNTPMMHYQFRIYPCSVGYPVPANSRINLIDILDLPITNLSGGDIVSAGRPKAGTP